MRQQTYRRCSQWYFTIDGLECSNPQTINGIVESYVEMGRSHSELRQGTIIGVCRGTSVGYIISCSHQVAMNIRNNCNGRHPGGDGYTGWQSTTTLIVEELCPPQ